MANARANGARCGLFQAVESSPSLSESLPEKTLTAFDDHMIGIWPDRLGDAVLDGKTISISVFVSKYLKHPI